MRGLVAALLLVAGAAGAADRPAFAPRIGAQLDPQARLVASDGQGAALADWLDGRPGLVVFGYDLCPNLCGVTQVLVAGAMPEVALAPDAYRLLFVSIAPEETPADAAAAKARLGEAVPGALGSWRFLTGAEGARLAGQAGLSFDRQARTRDYDHPIALIALTPDARIAQVLPAMSFTPEALELALVEASGGRLGTLGQNLYLLCAHFDPTQGQYTLPVTLALQVAGLLTVAALAFAVRRMARRGG